MVNIPSRSIEIGKDEIAIGNRAYRRKISPFEPATPILSNRYVLIQQGDEARYAISMKKGYCGRKHGEAIIEVLKAGFSVPSAGTFIPHYVHANRAINGDAVLYDATGKRLNGIRLAEYGKLLNNTGIFLNNSFEKGSGFLDLNVVYLEGIDKNGKPILKRDPLKRCLEKDCYADLESLNSQGFPTKESPIKKYEVGKSILFQYPRADSVAWYYAGSDWAYLYCGRDPSGSSSSLGVLTCVAEKKQVL